MAGLAVPRLDRHLPVCLAYIKKRLPMRYALSVGGRTNMNDVKEQSEP